VIVVLASVFTIFFVSSGSPGEKVEQAPPAAAPTSDLPEPAPAGGVLTETDQRQIAERNYAPAIKRLLDQHQAETAPAVKAALSRVGLKLSSAAKVTAAYRTAVAAEKSPTVRLRDGRITSYAGTPVPSVHAETIVDYARRSREVTELDLAWFLLVDGEARAALDRVFAGRDVRPEFRGCLEDIVETALAQKRDAREIVERLAAVRDRLPAAAAARVDAARK
jgi:hypothetical protein